MAASKTAKTTAAKPQKLRGAENVAATVDDDKIIFVVSRKVKGRPSQSGKTVVFASTRGNIEIPGADGLKVGLNIYGPVPDDDEE